MSREKYFRATVGHSRRCAHGRLLNVSRIGTVTMKMVDPILPWATHSAQAIKPFDFGDPEAGMKSTRIPKTSVRPEDGAATDRPCRLIRYLRGTWHGYSTKAATLPAVRMPQTFAPG
jgi:hypothetical protein